MDFATLLRQPVIPVVTVENAAHAAGLGRALSDGGLVVIEVTLRTDGALAAIREMADAAGGRVVVGAGTVLTPEAGEKAIESGAQFLVSPGASPRLIEASMNWKVPLMPGVATPSEAMALADMGFVFQKFFPAEANGGTTALKAWAAPLAHVTFCPTGGVTAANAPDYLALPNVACVGGSWVAPAAAVGAGDWDTIRQLARQASRIG